MTFGGAGWLWLLLLVPLVALLHLRRPRAHRVSSLVVWRRVENVRATKDAGRSSVKSWPLVLQMLAIAGLSLALAEPRFGYRSADYQIFLLDTSARMLTGDAGDTLLDRAFTRLVAEVSALPRTAEVTVIEVGPRPHASLVKAYGGPASSERLLRPVGSAAAADWHLATALASVVLEELESSSITVISEESGASRLDAALADSPLATVDRRWVDVGPSLPNAGVTGAGWTMVSGEPNIILVTANLAATEAVESFEVGFEFKPDESPGYLPWGTFQVDASPSEGGRLQQQIELPGPGVLRLKIERVQVAQGTDSDVAVGFEDGYPADDIVELNVSADPRSQLLVVGDVPEGLRRVLGLIGGVTVYVSDELPEDTTSFDLVIVTDRSEIGVPSTSTLWLGAFPGGAADLQTVSAPQVSDWSGDHLLAPSTGWQDLRLRAALVTPRLSGTTVLLESGGLPLIQARTTEVGRQVVVAFALEDSNWVDLSSFPSFLASVVDWVMPVEERNGTTACAVSMTCRLPIGTAAGSWRVMGPAGVLARSGRSYEAADPYAASFWPPGADEPAFVPEQPGTYRLDTVSGQRLIPVVADSSAFALDVAGEGGTPENGRVAAPSRAVTLDPMRVLAFAVAVLVAVNAYLLLRAGKFGRGRRRAVRALLTIGALGLLLASWSRLPVPTTNASSAKPIGISVSIDQGTEDEPEYTDGALLKVVGMFGDEAPSSGEPEGSSGAAAVERKNDRNAIAVPASDIAFLLAGGLARAIGTADVLVTDPSATVVPSEAAHGHAARLAASGLRVSAVDLRPDERRVLDVTSAHIPAMAWSGSTVQALFTVESALEADALVRVTIAGDEVFSADTALSRGTNTMEFPLAFERPGPQVVTINVSAEDSETEATALVEVQTPPKVLLIASDSQAAATMSSALRLQGMDPTVEPALNAPWSREAWREWDLAILLDLPAKSLHSTQLEALESWVAEDAGGLLLLGGETAFGPGGYLRTALDRLSPLSAQVPREAPEVTMLFVIDRSGSMQQRVAGSTRMDIAKEATASAMDLLGPGSRVGIVVYDSEARVLVPIQSVSAKDEITSALEGVGAAGGTALHPALVQAREMLADVESSAIHLVVLTDGLSQPGDFAGVLGDLRQLGASVSFIGIGSSADRVQLGDLARLANGTVHVTDDVLALPSILAQEALMASAELVREGPTDVTGVDVSAEFVEDLPLSGKIGGYVLTEPKPEATVHLQAVGEEPAPLLASWRYGLGRVVSFASHGVGRWTAGWLQGGDFTRVWGQLARWASSSDVAHGLDVSLAVEGHSVVVYAETTAGGGEPLYDRTPVLQVDGEPATTLWETSPGRYVGAVDISTEGVHELRVVLGESGAPPLEAVRHVLTGPYTSAVPTRATAILVEGTGGEFLSAGDNLANIAENDWSWRPEAWPWLLLALIFFAAFLLLVYRLPDRSDVRWALARARDALPPAKPAQPPATPPTT